MQNETAPYFNWPAIAHQKITGSLRHHDRLLLIKNAELHENVRKFHILDAVYDQTHGTLLRVRTDINNRTRKPAVFHSRHGEKELSIQKTSLFVGVSENLHENKGIKDCENDNVFW